MEKTFIRVRSIKDIVIFVALIVLGSVLVALPTGAAVNITGFFLLFAGLILALVLKTGLAAALINAVPFAQWNILVVMISGGLICWILSNFISNSAAANLIVPILAVVGTALLDDPTSSTSFLALGGEPCDKARRFLKTSGYDI